MAHGLSVVRANAELDTYRATGVSLAAGAVYLQLHTGDPGASGTSSVSTTTTRNLITFNTPTGGSMTLSSIGSYSFTTTHTITHVSLWSAASGGSFIQSGQLTTSVPVINGSTLNFTTLTLARTPIAA